MAVQFPTATTDDPQSVCDNFEKYLIEKKMPAVHEETVHCLDVPDFLKCAITDELMTEPVLIESGHTYEKEMILKHFDMSGAFDPITRQEVNRSIMVPNHTLKKASLDFLAKNPWAYQHIINEDYRGVFM